MKRERHRWKDEWLYRMAQALNPSQGVDHHVAEWRHWEVPPIDRRLKSFLFNKLRASSTFFSFSYFSSQRLTFLPHNLPLYFSNINLTSSWVHKIQQKSSFLATRSPSSPSHSALVSVLSRLRCNAFRLVICLSDLADFSFPPFLQTARVPKQLSSL